MAKTKEQLQNILEQFQLADKVVSAEPFGNGHINDTLKVTNEKGEIKYVLQRINHLVFTNVDMLQNNIQIVTSHIRKKLEEKGESDIDRKVLTFFPTLPDQRQQTLLFRWRQLLARIAVHPEQQKLRGGNTRIVLRSR